MSEQTKDLKTESTKKSTTGKRPLSERPKLVFGEYASTKDKLAVPPQLRQEIEEQGYEMRFIDRVQLIKNSGFHERQWQPYPYSPETPGLTDSLIGKSPEGYYQRGSAVLAVRPKEFGERHRAELKEKADRLSGKKFTQKKAAEIRDYAKEIGFETSVTEGDDDEN